MFDAVHVIAMSMSKVPRWRASGKPPVHEWRRLDDVADGIPCCTGARV